MYINDVLKSKTILWKGMKKSSLVHTSEKTWCAKFPYTKSQPLIASGVNSDRWFYTTLDQKWFSIRAVDRIGVREDNGVCRSSKEERMGDL